MSPVSLGSSKVPGRTGTERQVGLPEGRSRAVEVIQPQIPLRLPCYDLSPLAEPRFDLLSRPHPDPTRVL